MHFHCRLQFENTDFTADYYPTAYAKCGIGGWPQGLRVAFGTETNWDAASANSFHLLAQAV